MQRMGHHALNRMALEGYVTSVSADASSRGRLKIDLEIGWQFAQRCTFGLIIEI